jgi:hypothetical protein
MSIGSDVARPALRTRPLPQPTASSLVVESFFFFELNQEANVLVLRITAQIRLRSRYGRTGTCPVPSA